MQSNEISNAIGGRVCICGEEGLWLSSIPCVDRTIEDATGSLMPRETLKFQLKVIGIERRLRHML